MKAPSAVRSIIWRPSTLFAGPVVTISAQVPSSGEAGSVLIVAVDVQALSAIAFNAMMMVRHCLFMRPNV